MQLRSLFAEQHLIVSHKILIRQHVLEQEFGKGRLTWLTPLHWLFSGSNSGLCECYAGMAPVLDWTSSPTSCMCTR